MLYKLKLDWVLFICVFLLLCIGLSVLYSLSLAGIPGESAGLSVFWRQLIFVAIGLGAMLFFTFFNFRSLKSHSTPIYFATLFLLVLVLILGRNVRGHTGWIGLGPFTIQPVEFTKLTIIIFLASFISQKKMELEETGRLIASLVLIGIAVSLVMMQRDLGSTMVLVGIWLGMTLVSGMSGKKILIMFAAGFVIAFAGWFHLQQYQKDRIMNLVSPSSADTQGSGYNVIQAEIAVGSGGTIGSGIGHGSQAQLNFLPEKHTDFMFASIAEELGLAGSLFVICLFLLMFYRMREIAKNAPDNFGYLVAVGIMLMIFIQVLVNIGMNIGVMPVTGIPLPFLSYGGSSLITIMASIGILNNIHSQKEYLVGDEQR
jgi:rod shape determining protein RodA